MRVGAADVGEPGCGVWHVRPRLGLIGMLMGWWQVKLSSGCPLAEGRLSRPATAEDDAAMGRRSRQRASAPRASRAPGARAPR